MANFPPTVNVVAFKGTVLNEAKDIVVNPLLPTQLLGQQDGLILTSLRELLSAQALHSNRVVEFLDNRYALHANAGSPDGLGVFRQSGPTSNWARAWGNGVGDTFRADKDGNVSGLHVLHPNGVPTMCFMLLIFGGGSDASLYVVETTDGTSYTSTLLELNGAGVAANAQAIVYRNTLYWVHGSRNSVLGIGAITSFDLVSRIAARHNINNANGNNLPINYAFHVHKNKLLLCGNRWNNNSPWKFWRLDAGTFAELVEDAGTQTPGNAHSLMFTDQVSGDLVIFQSSTSGGSGGTKVRHMVDAESANPGVLLTITGAVLGVVEGANKYIGTSQGIDRKWIANVDTESDPANPRTFLTTWVPGGNTETWEWKGLGAEIEAVALLAGISDFYALPYNTLGGGHRSPRVAAVEVGDTANPPEEVIGGTKIYFRGRGVAAAGTLTFYGGDDETTPVTVVPMALASFTVESGSSGTPSQSGNTIIGFVPDNGATLYSVVLDTGAAGVDIAEGDVGLIIPSFV